MASDWSCYGPLGDQKVFALAVKDRPWASLLFALRKDPQPGFGGVFARLTQAAKYRLLCPEMATNG